MTVTFCCSRGCTAVCPDDQLYCNLHEDENAREMARLMGVRVIACPYSDVYGNGTDYRVQKRGLFGIWWTQGTFTERPNAESAAKRLVRGEPLDTPTPTQPVVWP